MTRFAAVLWSLIPAGVLGAQSNAIPGLDARLASITSLTYWGRVGPAQSGGEVAVSMQVDTCNSGSVAIPWQQAMAANHPKLAFLVCRVANGRIEQISGRGHVRHAAAAANTSGSCGTCSAPGTSQLLGPGCSDSTSATANADRYWLGPAAEVDPWLGTWQPTGSYFDQGDPPAAGALATDGVRSLTAAQTAGFDVRKGRVVVREADLLTAGASYWYAAQLTVAGESGANRANNLVSRGCSPVWSGSFWTFANNTQAVVAGSVLGRWPGAEVNVGQNGGDDGRLFVASLVTPLGNGNYHYEYAVHNADNARGAASFRVPIPAAAAIANVAFGDVDDDPTNDWSAAVVGGEVVFTAPAGNPLDWNTIYNFAFDCAAPPGPGLTSFDAARSGPGSASFAVAAKVPGAPATAGVSPVGVGCGGDDCWVSFYELFTAASPFDLANTSWMLTPQAGGYVVGPSPLPWAPPNGTAIGMLDDFENAVSVPFSFPYPGGSTTTLWVGSNGCVGPVSIGSEFEPTAAAFLAGPPRWAALWHDLSPTTGQVLVEATSAVVRIHFVAVPNYGGVGTVTFQYQFFPNGTVHVLYGAITVAGNNHLVGFSRGGGGRDPGSWDVSAGLPAGLTLCAATTPSVALAASARPILGTTLTLNTTAILAGSLLGLSILSPNQLPGVDLTGLGMPGCRLYAALDSITPFATAGATGSVPLVVPNVAGLAGLEFLSQSATLTPNANAFGFVVSNGVLLLLGNP